MKELMLLKDFYMYQFEENKNNLGSNIFVLFGIDECIVFDTGYEPHMKQVLDKLKNHKIKYVICTHFHPDHCYGLNVLDNPVVIGSKYYEGTLEMFDQQLNKKLIPSILVENKLSLTFGNHIVDISINQGHSLCGTIISIDNQFLLVGDDIMSNNKGVAVIPYVADTVEKHIIGLQKIKEKVKDKTMLPSHGMPITKDVLKQIDLRLSYLIFAKEHDDLDEYKEKDLFLNQRWHTLNINNRTKD